MSENRIHTIDTNKRQSKNDAYNKVILNTPKRWFVTIKDIRHDCNPGMEDYDIIIDDILKTYKGTMILDRAVETDRRGIVHVHLIIAAKYVQFGRIRKRYRGYSIDYALITSDADYKRITNYLDKQRLSDCEAQDAQACRAIKIKYPFLTVDLNIDTP